MSLEKQPRHRKTVPATYIRGGTSRAVFFHENDLPPSGNRRDQFLLRLMGSPSRTQIDGIGGATTHTSKVAIVKRSDREDADIDWTHAQVGIDTSTVSYSGGCGNISSAVAAFAINKGWTKLQTSQTEGSKHEVRILHTGSQSILRAFVPIDVDTGEALEDGNYAISGVNGTGAPIDMDYSLSIGGSLSRGALPTGNVQDKFHCGDAEVEATICDAGNLFIFAPAHCFGVTGSEGEAELDAVPGLLDSLKELRGKAAQALGMCTDWNRVDEECPGIPGGLLVCLVSHATDQSSNIQLKLLVGTHFHSAMAGTGGVCAATCSRMEGSIVHQFLSAGALESDDLIIQHPSGILPISIRTKVVDSEDPVPLYELISFVRTARYIFRGDFFIPNDFAASY